MRSIVDLPVELLIDVLSYLGTDELVKCQQVCSGWNEILRFHNGVWPVSVVVCKHESSNYIYYINSPKCCKHDISNYYVNELKCSNLDDVRLVCHSMSKLRGKITSLKLNIDVQEVQLTFFTFRCFLPLKYIDVQVSEISYHDVACLLDRETLKALKSLKLKAGTLTGREAETIFFEQLRRSNTPELQELEIWMDNAANYIVDFRIA
jgi:hypothetical protein